MSRKRNKKCDDFFKSVHKLSWEPLKKEKEMSLDTLTKPSIDNAIVSRLDGIPTKERIIVNNEIVTPPNVYVSKLSEIEALEYLSSCDNDENNVEPFEFTLIIADTKKRVLRMFEYDYVSYTNPIDYLNRVSTLPDVYKAVENRWVELNKDDSTNFTNVMYLPEIIIFLTTNRKLRKDWIKLNLLVVAIPTQNDMGNDIESLSDQGACKYTIGNMMDAAIKCGARNLIINPHQNKLLRKDLYMTSDLWMRALLTTPVKENIESIHFVPRAHDDFIIFKNFFKNFANQLVRFTKL